MSLSPMVTAVLIEPNHSGSTSKHGVCVHDIECPPGAGWAISLGGPSYLQNPSTQASVAYVLDPVDLVAGVEDESVWTWSAGTPGSAPLIHIEQAGYASMSRAQWLGLLEAAGTSYDLPNGGTRVFTAQDARDMATQFDRLARLIADIHHRNGWGRPSAATCPQLQQMVNGADLGMDVRHVDISGCVGGTVHHDPGAEYPWPELEALAGRYYDGDTPTEPTEPIEPPEDELSADDVKAINAHIDEKIQAAQREIILRIQSAQGEDRRLTHGLQNALIVNRAAVITAITRAQKAGGTPDQIADAVVDALGEAPPS